jgi:hypothetical protein
MRNLVDIHYPRRQPFGVVMDNLNTHTLGSLYEAFPPEEATTRRSTAAGVVMIDVATDHFDKRVHALVGVQWM